MLRKQVEDFMKRNGMTQIDLVLNETDKLGIYCFLKNGVLNDYTGHVVPRKHDIWGYLEWRDSNFTRKPLTELVKEN